MKLCTVCGVITSRAGSRCTEHPRLSGIGANHHVHADPRWTRLSKRMIARHVGQHGYVCPGDGPEHPAHPTRDLTLDHVTALIDGGAPFDPANTRVLCRSRNSANGARLVNARRADRGSPHADPALLEVRLINETLGYGGTLDLIAELDGETWLLDWKTGKSVAWPDGSVYADHRLQLAAYANAGFIARIGDPERHPLPAVTRFGIVHVTDGGTRLYEADVTERDWIAFRACLNLWDWQKNGGKAA